MAGGVILIESVKQVDEYEDHILMNSARTASWLKDYSRSALELLWSLKFEEVGRHPVDEGYSLNLIEQVNQTWTYLVALEAVRWLLKEHPDAGGFRVAPGAHMAQPLDIMSVVPGCVGAEVFAAVRPSNNDKLRDDIRKLRKWFAFEYRYVFFASPNIPSGRYREHIYKDVEVWALDLAAFRSSVPADVPPCD